VPDWQAIWDFISSHAQAIWGSLSAVAHPAWQFLCAEAERLIDKLLPYPDAVTGAIYLLVVIGLATTYATVHPDYAYYSLRRHGFGKKAARDVWYLTLALLLFGGFIHAAETTKIALDPVSPPIPFDLSPGTKLALVGNATICAIAVALYLWHAFKRSVNVIRGFRPFFTPILGLFGTEHLMGMYSRHYELDKITDSSLKFLHSLNGAMLLESLITVTVISGLAYLMQSFLRHRDAGMKQFEHLTDRRTSRP
jgi:hypothetical protein